MGKLTTAQVAAAANCSEVHVRNCRRRGLLEFEAVPRNSREMRYYYPPESVKVVAGAKAAGLIKKTHNVRLMNHGNRSEKLMTCHREWCSRQGRPCVIRDIGSCQTCEAEHRIDSVVGGASSGWTVEQVGAGR